MINVEANIGIPRPAPLDTAAIAGAIGNGARTLPSRYPQSDMWEITVAHGRAKYSVRNAAGEIKSYVQAVGRGADRLSVGQVVEVRYYDRDRKRPYIVAGIGWATWGTAITIYLGTWSQSNAESHQNALGSWVAAGMVYSSSTDWPLPNTDTVGVYETQSVALGLVRAVHTDTATDRYITALPVRRVSTSLCDLAIIAWDVAGKSVAWRVDWTTGDTWPMTDAALRSCSLFYSQLSRRVTFIPQPSLAAPIIYSGGDGLTSDATTMAKPALCASCHGWDANGTTTLRIVLPYTNATYTTIQFWAQDPTTGALSSVAAIAPNLLIGSEYTTIPSGHDAAGPVAWWSKYCYLFASGLIAAGSRYAWALRAVSDGLPGRGDVVTSLAVSDPAYLTEWDFSADALAEPYISGDTFTWIPLGTSYWTMAQAVIASTTDAAFATWTELCPIQFPLPAQNDTRLGAIDNHDATAWPATLINAGGGVVIDATYAWAAVAIPTQHLALGHYVVRTTPTSSPTWQVYKVVYITGATYSSATTTWTFHHSDPGYIDTSTGSGTDPDPYIVTIYTPTDLGNQDAKEGVWTADLCYLWRTYLIAQNLSTGARQTTDISQLFTVGGAVSLTESGGTTVSATRDNVPTIDNIWQLISLPGKSVIVVLRDLHADALGNNPSPHLEIYDYSAGCANMPKLSTVTLGTQDLVSESTSTTTATESFTYDTSQGPDGVTFHLGPSGDIDSIDAVYVDDPGNPVTYTYTPSTLFDPAIIVLDVAISDPEVVYVEYTQSTTIPIPPESIDGDRAWDPYTFGPPRMKATAAILDGGAAHPVIQVAVYERKKVDDTVQSEFRRATYHEIDLSDPSSPVTTTTVVTSADLGVGGGVANPGGDGPLWDDWDSLIATGGVLAWARGDKVFESL